jgi:hypothetical protein
VVDSLRPFNLFLSVSHKPPDTIAQEHPTAQNHRRGESTCTSSISIQQTNHTALRSPLSPDPAKDNLIVSSIARQFVAQAE